MIEPRRLSEREGSSEIGAALRQAREATGGDEQLARLWQRLASSAAAPSQAEPSVLTQVSAAKGATALMVVGVAAITAVAYLLASEGDRARVRAPEADTAPPVRPAAPITAAAPAAPESILGAPGVTPSAEPSRVRAPSEPPPRSMSARRAPRERPARTTSVPAQPRADADTELALLTRAERALERTPAAALALLDEHAQRFPDGLLAQEREILSIDAQLALGRRAAAVERAKAFLARFPSSAHRHRLTALLASNPAGGTDRKLDPQRIPTR